MRISRLLFSVCAALTLQGAFPAFADPPKPTTPSGADSAPPKDRLEQARDLYRKGLDAYKKKDWATACDRFAASWAIKEHYQIAGNLGACSMKLDRYVDAARFLSIFLRELPSGETPDSRASAQTDLAAATARIGTLRLSVFEWTPAPTVWLDGARVGGAPLPDALFVAPGHHLLEVRLDDGTGERTEVDAKAGEALDVRIERTPPPIPAATMPIPVPLPPPPLAALRAPEARRSIVPVVVGLGLTTVGVALGVTFAVAARGKAGHADDLRAVIADKSGSATSGCADPGPTYDGTCRELAATLDSQTTLNGAATASFVVAAVAAVGTGVYLLWPKPKTSSAGNAGHALRWVAGPLSLGVNGTW